MIKGFIYRSQEVSMKKLFVSLACLTTLISAEASVV